MIVINQEKIWGFLISFILCVVAVILCPPIALFLRDLAFR